MLYAAIDIHKHAFQAAVLDPDSGELVQARFSADRESLECWAEQWRGRVAAVAIEATTGWRWVWRELVAHGFEVRLAKPVQARALLGRRRSPKTDRLDARWLARLLAKEIVAGVVDPAGGDPAAARPHAAAQEAGRGPAPLGTAVARVPGPRGMAVREVAAAVKFPRLCGATHSRGNFRGNGVRPGSDPL